MIAVDTSVVVAPFPSWHEGHVFAVSALARRPRLPAHFAVEAFSTAKRASASLLTRDRRAAPTYEAVGVRYELLS